MPIIEIDNLTKDYEVGFWRKRKVRALDSLSVTVNQGEIFGFLGANGAGKTTTLKVLMRLVFPTSGSARILNQDIADVAMHQQIGYLPENPYFYDYLTALEFLDYCGQIFGFSQEFRDQRSRSLLDQVHLEEKSWNTQLRKFSKGMLQRVGMAQALINDPKVVFLDEPMSGLDPLGRRQVRDLIASLRSQGKTVFMCSHILSDIEVLCDRIAILKRGRLAHLGRLDELRGERRDTRLEVITSGADPATLKGYLGTHHVEVVATASGLRLEIESEQELDGVLAALRQAGGRVIAVQPLRHSLEELFLDDATST
jgi:ABC-2 type transport system ATP-binding protein